MADIPQNVQPSFPPPLGAQPTVAPAAAQPPTVAPVAGEPPVATPRRRRRWPYLVLLSLVVFLLGAGASYLLTKPTNDDLRDSRDALQGQLDQANDQLDQVNKQLDDQKHIASAAQAAQDACQRLSTDAQQLSDNMNALEKLLQDPANNDVAPGSAEEKALFDQLDTLSGSITFEQGAVTSDAAACKSAATGV